MLCVKSVPAQKVEKISTLFRYSVLLMIVNADRFGADSVFHKEAAEIAGFKIHRRQERMGLNPLRGDVFCQAVPAVRVAGIHKGKAETASTVSQNSLKTIGLTPL